jgi:hypothetical protein
VAITQPGPLFISCANTAQLLVLAMLPVNRSRVTALFRAQSSLWVPGRLCLRVLALPPAWRAVALVVLRPGQRGDHDRGGHNDHATGEPLMPPILHPPWSAGKNAATPANRPDTGS